MIGSVELNAARVGMSRNHGKELAKDLISNYENRLENAPVDKKYQDCYDFDTGLPCQEYIDLYGEVKEELQTMGFNSKHKDDANGLGASIRTLRHKTSTPEKKTIFYKRTY